MARQVKRNVKRQTISGREGLVKEYSTGKWYELPEWAKDWIVDTAPWAMLLLSIFLAPAAAIALVLGFHTLPLEFLGVPPSGAGLGLAAGVLLLKFILVALAVRPLFRRRIRGWHLLVAAAAVHLVHSIVLQHAFSGLALFLFVIYLNIQVRRRYQE